MIIGETVAVLIRQQTGTNAMNQPVYDWVPDGDDAGNVLVAPGATGDLEGSIRPDGVEVVYTLHWPKTDTRNLRGKRVTVRGETFDVIGDPKAYQDDMTPGDWDRPVQVKAVSG